MSLSTEKLPLRIYVYIKLVCYMHIHTLHAWGMLLLVDYIIMKNLCLNSFMNSCRNYFYEHFIFLHYDCYKQLELFITICYAIPHINI